jgi:zinc/manganese transport system permease protein
VLLILTLVITPAAAAQYLASRPSAVFASSVAISLGSTIGGILLALAQSWPTSFFISSLSFTAYILARLLAVVRR